MHLDLLSIPQSGVKNAKMLLFLTFSVLVANPKKLLYTVANPARGLLNREKRTKEKVWQHPPPPTPHTARSEKINKITRRIYRRYAGLGRSRVRTRIPSARRLGLWVWLKKSAPKSLKLKLFILKDVTWASKLTTDARVSGHQACPGQSKVSTVP